MTKVLLIVCDALRSDVARKQMGYLEHLIEEKRASFYTMVAGLPTLSRPLYETIHTGTPVAEHGISSNVIDRRSNTPSIFSVARENNKTTAAAAYCWYSELYVRTPFDLVMDRELDDETQLIQHGRFYRQDDYPDIELFADGGMLMRRHAPDYLLIHPMGLDTIGHKYGGNSPEYHNQAILQDQIMANLVPLALLMDYTIFVTGDHGMNDAHQHNGTLPDVRHVPFYVITPDGKGKGDTELTVSQLQIAPTVCRVLGIPAAPTMTYAPIDLD